MATGLLAFMVSPLIGGEVGVNMLWDVVDDVSGGAAAKIDPVSDMASIFSLAISSSPTERLLCLDNPPRLLTYSV